MAALWASDVSVFVVMVMPYVYLKFAPGNRNQAKSLHQKKALKEKLMFGFLVQSFTSCSMRIVSW